ncbi:hypothetical protein QOT17_002749 [Balamuthia mandrillaris]
MSIGPGVSGHVVFELKKQRELCESLLESLQSRDNEVHRLKFRVEQAKAGGDPNDLKHEQHMLEEARQSEGKLRRLFEDSLADLKRLVDTDVENSVAVNDIKRSDEYHKVLNILNEHTASV